MLWQGYLNTNKFQEEIESLDVDTTLKRYGHFLNVIVNLTARIFILSLFFAIISNSRAKVMVSPIDWTSQN